MADLPTGVQQLYEGLWDAAAWQDGLDKLCAGFRAHHLVALNVAAGGDRDGSTLCWGAHVAAEHLDALVREVSSVLMIADGMRVGVAMDTAEVISDREFARTRIYRTIVRPMGGHYGLTASPFAGGLLALCRPPTARRFAAPEISRLQAVLPHLQTTLRLKRHLVGLESRAAAFEETLDEIGVGVLLAAGSGQIIYANQSAEATLRTVRQADGAAASGRRMREVIGQPDGRRHPISRGPFQRPVTIRAVPLSGRTAEQLSASSECRVAVFLRDPDQHGRISHPELMASLGLTLREASLAKLLAHDMTITEAAAALSITRENARIHLKRIFSKTNTRRQAELVSLILRSTV